MRSHIQARACFSRRVARRPLAVCNWRYCVTAWASPLQIFMKVQFPAALPFIFAGAKVAVTLAVIGAVIGEFIGSMNGLGNLLLTANSQLDSPLAWAALVWLSVMRRKF